MANESLATAKAAALAQPDTKQIILTFPRKHPAPLSDRVRIPHFPVREGRKSARESYKKIKKCDIRYGEENIADGKCVICCDGVPDAVVLPCCHGGICYDCAVKISKQGSACAYCRKVLKEFDYI